MVHEGVETTPPLLTFLPGPCPALACCRPKGFPYGFLKESLRKPKVATPLGVSARPVSDPQGMGGSHPGLFQKK